MRDLDEINQLALDTLVHICQDTVAPAEVRIEAAAYLMAHARDEQQRQQIALTRLRTTRAKQAMPAPTEDV